MTSIVVRQACDRECDVVFVNADAARSLFLSADEEVLFSGTDHARIGLPTADREPTGFAAADRDRIAVLFFSRIRTGWSHL